MRRHAFLLALLLVASGAFAEGWDEIYTARLNSSATYLESRLTLNREADYARVYEAYIHGVHQHGSSDQRTDDYSRIIVAATGRTSGTLNLYTCDQKFTRRRLFFEDHRGYLVRNQHEESGGLV